MTSYIRNIILVSSMMTSCENSSEDRTLHQIADFGKSMAIGLSVNSENRIFVSFPNYDGNGNLALAEVIDGSLHPYPNEAWNVKGSADDQLFRVQDLYVDANDYLWVLDSKPASTGNIFGDDSGDTTGHFKLVKINTKTNEVDGIFTFEDLDKSNSALNDVRIDTEKNLAYLSDPGLASIVVLDLETKRTRSVLAKSPYTIAKDRVLVYDGKKMQDKTGNPFSSNVNSIALTKDFKYFYFKPINTENLYRIATSDLANEEIIDDELSGKVEDLGKVGITHGMIADKEGNVYFASSEEYKVCYITSYGKVNTLIEDANLIWPDSFGIGPDGYLYFTCAQLQRLPQWNEGENKTDYPYKAFKVKLPH